MVTYPKVEEEDVGLENLEASTPSILKKKSWSIFEIQPT